MNPVRRLAGALRWRIARWRKQRWTARGPRPIGTRRVRHLVIHAPVMRGVSTEITASLMAAEGLNRRGMTALGPTEMRTVGAAWSGHTGRPNPVAYAESVRAHLAPVEVVGPFRAVIVTSGRALGRDDLMPDETTVLRPKAEATLRDLIAGFHPRRVSVVVEHRGLVALRDEIIGSQVASGLPPPDIAVPDPAVMDDLVRRIGRIPRVKRVVVLAADEATSVRFAKVVERWVKIPFTLVKRPRPGLPDWTLRSAQAAAAAAPHLDESDRRKLQLMLRATLTPPARGPSLLVPRADAAVDVAPRAPLELFLHVGLQKTATTSVQSVLRSSHEQLAGQGVAYVDRSVMMRLGDRRAWRAYTHTGKASFSRLARQLQGAVAKARQRDDTELGRVLISNESAVGAMEKGPFLERPFRPRAEGAIADLLDMLQPDSCHLILVVRRQDTMLESQYMWQIHGGEWFTFDRYAAHLLAHPDAMSHTGLADRLARIPGIDGLTVIPFELIRRGFDGFLGALLAPTGARLAHSERATSTTKNPAYSERALEIALGVNPHLRGRKEHRLMRDHLRDLLPVETWGRPTLCDEATRNRILEALASDNEALFRRWMPQYPADSYGTTATESRLTQAVSNSPATG